MNIPENDREELGRAVARRLFQEISTEDRQKMAETCGGYIRRKISEPALGRRAMNAVDVGHWPIHGIFVFMYDPDYHVRFDLIHIHGVCTDHKGHLIMRCI